MQTNVQSSTSNKQPLQPPHICLLNPNDSTTKLAYTYVAVSNVGQTSAINLPWLPCPTPACPLPVDGLDNRNEHVNIPSHFQSLLLLNMLVVR